MSSDGPNHNEFDFEFLGNTTGEPHLVQTNVYMNGVGNRKQRMDLWFVPTKDSQTNSRQGNESSMTFTCPLGPIQIYKRNMYTLQRLLQSPWLIAIPYTSDPTQFMMDETPIRAHTNLEHKGIPFPKDQPMGAYNSIWNADEN
ncbi:xyloglucan endotransglucosylase/hydrolase protein 9-like [Mangifera indica]|uniref:xyloglucan endotransglucosylase/hydrolase protein 9-like n=1 Tax=Mangifera indica TaxID=29780 RepID=UPI001CFB8B09|nr:xyloglucan endotransglucosylase/hydrolase protein 9-like [Mangifera indica]